MSILPPILIFCEDGDPIARRAAKDLASRTGHPVEVCTSTDLTQASYFVEPRVGDGIPVAQATPHARAPHSSPPQAGAAEYAVHPAGSQSPVASASLPGEIVLRDGRIFLQDRLQGVWNRLTHWPDSVAGRQAGAADSMATWIAAVRQSLLGEPGIRTAQLTDSWSQLHWSRAASRAGLPIFQTGYRASSRMGCIRSVPPLGERVAVLVTGDRHCASGPLAEELGSDILAACVRLAQSAGRFLEVRLVPHGQSGWRFAEAKPNPDPFPHGTQGLANLAAYFSTPSAARGDRAALASLEGAG